jgi:hypothetical protein
MSAPNVGPFVITNRTATLAPVTICWFISHLPRIHHELFQGF